jgi:hypothetical protein
VISSDIIIFGPTIDNVKILTLPLFLLAITITQAQVLTQQVKGTITDQVSGNPLAAASVMLTAGTSSFGGQADVQGKYSVSLPVGRYKLTISFTGYQSVEQEVLVISGRETIVNVSLMQAARDLQEVEVTSSALTAELPGLRSLTIEKTMRVPANFFDPVRVATAYPGVVAANDQGNSIIVRGNSPNGLLWRLNGLDIVNPNHLANAGTLSDKPAANGGGVNILSAQMLDKTDFYMGAFPANYGNALSGIIDMKLRPGNKNRMEYTGQASLIGMDMAAEGPLGKKQNTSFLANYRYSTVGLLSKLGVKFGDEDITFQDLSFHLNTNLRNGGELSFFGLGGNSINDFKHKDARDWKEDKDKYDIRYTSGTYATGLNYIKPSRYGKFFAGVAYSSSQQKRNANPSPDITVTELHTTEDHYALTNELLSTNLRYEIPLREKGVLEIGVMTNYISNRLDNTQTYGCLTCAFHTNAVKGTVSGMLVQPFTNLRLNLSSITTLNAGVRYLNFTYNNTNSIEPRVNINVKATSTSSFDLAYSLVSQLQLAQVYLANGNKDLGFTRSHHADFSYNQALANDLKLRTGLFYQHLFNVPILSSPLSNFSVVNLLEGFSPAGLRNRGTGDNYGVDATLEKLFYARQYMMLGGSYYNSQYVGGDGVKRDTRFNGNYTFSAVYGKEWSKAEKNRVIALSTRLLYLGGQRHSAVNTQASQTSGETIYQSDNPYNQKLKDYARLDVRLSFRKNKVKYTRTFSIDIQNLTGQQNEAYQYYDLTQQKVVMKYQLGVIPVIAYRIDF